MRLSWIDAVKGFAIIGVVFGHVEAGYLNRGIFLESAFILQALWDMGHVWRMPLFFLASGYLYELTWNNKAGIDRRKIIHKFFDIGSLYLLFSALFWTVKYASGIYIQRGFNDVQMVSATTIQDLILIPLKPYSYLWFLWVLALLFIIVPVGVNFFKARKFITILFAAGYLIPWDSLESIAFINGGLYRNCFMEDFIL